MKGFLSTSTLLLVVLFTACVPQQQYAELEETLNYYKAESLATDSIRGVNQRLQNDNDNTQADYQALVRDMEQLTATNISLNRNYQDVVQRYNALVGENQQVLAATSYETTNLQQELSLRQNELDNKERQLSSLEYQLQNRQNELERLEARGGTGSPNAYDANGGDPRYADLRAQKSHLDQRLTALESGFQRVLVGFPAEEVAIQKQEHGIVLTLSQPLLFPQTNTEVHWKGRQALQQIALVLRENADVEVQVVGHQYLTNNTDYDLEVSLQRGAAVSRALATYGVDPANLVVSGQGSASSVVSTNNMQSQVLNSRTEIFVNLDYQNILNALD